VRKNPVQLDLPLWLRWPMPRCGPWTMQKDPSVAGEEEVGG